MKNELKIKNQNIQNDPHGSGLLNLMNINIFFNQINNFLLNFAN